jgi:hypothetical protein
MISSSSRIAQPMIWDTGEAKPTLGDADSNEVVEEHREITPPIGLYDATQTLLAWVETTRRLLGREDPRAAAAAAEAFTPAVAAE